MQENVPLSSNQMYPPESAGGLMITNIPTAYLTDKTSKVLSSLSKGSWDAIHSVYVVSKENELLGIVPLSKLLSVPSNMSLSEIMMTPKVIVRPELDQERVVIEALRNDLKTIPVVSKDNKFLGAVEADAIIDVLHQEHLEDFLRISGIRGRGAKIINLVDAHLLEQIRLRVPWLIIGLMGGIFASVIVSRFESSLQENITLAFFISMVAYMSDAIGTQSETIFVRALTLLKFNIVNYIFRELAVGIVIGTIVGLTTGIFAVSLTGSAATGVAVGLSLALSMSIATVLACVTPIILKHLGKDPAVGSGPFTTAIQDLVSLSIYFTVASAIFTWIKI